LFLAAVNQVFSLLDPQIFRMIIDRYVTNFQDYDTRTFVLGVGGLLLLSVGVAMVSRIAKNFQDYFANVMTQNIGMQIYQTSIRHAFSLPYSVLEDQQSGQLLDKLNKARQSIQAFIISLINNVFVAMVGLVFVLIYASTVHRVITVFYASVIPVMGIIVYTLSKRLKKAQQAIVTETAGLAGATTETIRNVGLVKSLGLEEQEMERLEEVNTQILWLELKKIKTVRLIDFSQGTLINLMRVCLLGTMFWLVYQQSITLGEFFSLYFYSFYIFSPLYMLGEVLKNYQEAKASHELVQELLEQQPAVDEHVSSEQITSLDSVVFNDVSFHYGEQKEVLQDINVELQRGETIAFVGPSGSGKSTIIKLLLGLYPVTDGMIRINDRPIIEYDPSALKALIGLVSQDTQLFSGTIRQNLQFVRPEASDEQMIRALEYAQLQDFLAHPDGLALKIGEWGLKLSGGQKQRLAIARALLREPQLLIFDEATSSLDSIVEADITETIKTISWANNNTLTTILIAHRLSTVVHAQRIYVLEKWVIVEQGTHDELLQMKWLYYSLWRQQVGE
jgi:ATP-binding cassette subfamily B protein